MNTFKYVLAAIFAIAQIGNAQSTDDLMLYRKDFKAISGENTVSVTSYEKGGKHYIFAGGVGNIDVYGLNEDGILSPISDHELH
ncbi:MAG: stress protein, partial [Maribacter dokdonensis]